MLDAFFEFDKRFYAGQITDEETRKNPHGFVVFDGRGYPIRETAKFIATDPTALAEHLMRSGFRVIPDRNWTEAEISLVCMLLHEAGWERTLRAAEEPVRTMSELLRSRSPLQRLFSNHRSPDSVHRKLEDLRTARKEYATKRTKGGDLTRTVARRYESDPNAVVDAAHRTLLDEVPSPVRRVLLAS